MAFATRRTFLKAALAGVASLFLPNFLFARRSPNFWFLHTPTGESWPIDDPVTWRWQTHSNQFLSGPGNDC